MKKTVIAASATSLVLLLGACSKDPSTSDFKKQTADFINGKSVAEQAGQDFSAASCEEPGSTSVGTTYTCTATGADGATYSFDVEITSKNGFTVQSFAPAGGTGTEATTTTTG